MCMGTLMDTRTAKIYLANDVLVRESNDKSVLGGVVLVLILNSQSLAGIVISDTLTATQKLHLKALEVLLVLDYFKENLRVRREGEKDGRSKRNKTSRDNTKICQMVRTQIDAVVLV